MSAALVSGFVALSACANYDEGDRCESGNGNDDCADGLQCTPAGQLAPGASNSDRCCPPDRSMATTSICAVATNPIGGDATPPPNTGPGTDGSTDANKDTGAKTDASEAGTDANADGDADDGG